MDNRVVSELSAALQCQADPSSSLEARAAALQYCENFAPHPDVAFHLLQYGDTPHVRFFGGYLLQKVIQQWRQLTSSQKTEIKTKLLAVAQTASFSPSEIFLRDQVSKLIIGITKPELSHTPDFLFELEPISRIDDQRCELICVAFRMLSEDVQEFDPADPKLKQKLQANAVRFLGFFRRIIDAAYTELSQMPSLDPVASQKSRLILTALGCIPTFVSWVKAEPLCRHHIWASIIGLILEPTFRLAAATCLLEITERINNSSLADKKQLMFLFKYIPQFARALELPSSDLEEQLRFHKQLCQALCSLGKTQLSVMHGTGAKELPENYDLFLQVMMTVAKHQNPKLSFYSLPFWQGFIESEVGKQAKPFVNELFLAFSEKIRALDLNEERDDDDFIPICTTSCSKFFSVLTHTFPQEALIFCGNSTSAFIALISSNNQPTYPTEQSQQLNRSMACVGWIFKVLPTNHDHLRPLSPTISQIQNMLLQFKPNSPQIQQNVMKILGELAPNYYTLPEIDVKPFIEYCANILLSLPPNNPSNIIPEARKKACTVLIRLGSFVAEKLLPDLPNMTRMVELLTSKNIPSTEHTLLLEFLVSIGNAFSTKSEQTNFLGVILKPYLEDWDALHKTEAFAGPLQFLAFLGVGQLTGNPSADSLVMERVRKLHHITKAYSLFWKRCNTPKEPAKLQAGGYINPQDQECPVVHPLIELDAALLEKTLAFVKILHQICDPTVRAQAPAGWDILYHPVPARFTQLKIKPKYPPDSTLELRREIQTKLFDIREYTYTFLAQIASHQTVFYRLNGLGDILNATIFEGIGNLSNIQRSQFIQLLLAPLFKHCPPSQMASLYPTLSIACFKLFQDIHTDWVSFTQSVAKAQEEAIHEYFLRAALFDYIKMVTEIFFEYSKTGKDEQRLTLHYFFEKEDLLVPFLATITHTLKLVDASSNQKALKLVCKILSLLRTPQQQQKGFVTQLLKDVLTGAIAIMARKGDFDLHSAVLATLVQIWPINSELLLHCLSESLPNSGEGLKELQKKMNAEQKDEKRAALLKKFLVSYGGMKQGRADSVLKLPDTLLLQNYGLS